MKVPTGVRGVIHGGAHLAEEMDEYIAAGIERSLWIEPRAELVDEMQKRHAQRGPSHMFVCAALGATHGEAWLHVASNSQSSSILAPATYLQEKHPSISFPTKTKVRVAPLDDLVVDPHLYDYLVLDVQGYELEVLRGATSLLRTLRYVRAEIATDEVYEGCARLGDLIRFMGDAGYELVEHFVWPGYAEGEALWRRT